ncbi:protein ROOT INITIATION DEFECTIVE 3-like isoform X2 [Benincasa hispida]|uniref:protein ROOT INITIATION DEFECTIVE 3-like isoform X2 n=1 Tax=Benincasa hispida TaxID=102211 RepID=UPI0019029D1F|nr:protein ROOT INITIATION DEFECTIVE 3-like isoform X2 [Benincasa hispida]
MKLVFSTRRNCRVRKVFDDGWQREGKHFYDHSFTGHNLPVTDIVVGYGGSNAIIISSSVDPTCKSWCSRFKYLGFGGTLGIF